MGTAVCPGTRPTDVFIGAPAATSSIMDGTQKGLRKLSSLFFFSLVLSYQCWSLNSLHLLNVVKSTLTPPALVCHKPSKGANAFRRRFPPEGSASKAAGHSPITSVSGN